MVKAELSKVEGKSAGLARPEPVRFALISGQRLVNEKIQEMLDNAKKEVLWMVPKLEIERAIFYDRDKMLRKCARRGVKVRVLTEVDEKNVNDVKDLSRFCDVRHVPAVTSMITIVDEAELIVSSAMHKGGGVYGTELVHKLWTNDSDHVNVMKDFFEKVWADSTPAKSEIETIGSRGLT
jgi:sugar-specific transcriptional regulator TrmB